MRDNLPILLCCLAAFLFSVDCGRTGPETPITRELKAAGAGDPAYATDKALHDWLFRHAIFAIHIADKCHRLPAEKSLEWTDSTEAHVCAVAEEVSYYAKFRMDPAQYVGSDHVPF